MAHARTRIVSTVGPASASTAVLAGLARAGTDVFRLNGAHVAVDEVGPWVRRIRRACKEAGTVAAVMVDLPGVKLRTGRFVSGDRVELVRGAAVTLQAGRRGATSGQLVVHPWPDVSGVRKDTPVLLDDGRLRLRVTRRSGAVLHAVVEEGGVLKTGKGVAFPGVTLDLAVPTRADLALAQEAVRAGADWLALSFVHAAEDVVRLRRACARAGRADMPIAAKIERGDAFEHLDAIATASDALLVARGDLGTDVGGENVPALQRQILDAACRIGRPAIVATEMLDSMVHRSRPTRAEVSDVAGAVFQGADAVLLSAETAVGDHPVLAVQTLERILRTVEDDERAPFGGAGPPLLAVDGAEPDRHVVRAGVLLAEETGARAICVFTRTGASAVRLSKERPHADIHAFSADARVERRLKLAWGVVPHVLPGDRDLGGVVARIGARLRREGIARAGDRVVLLMGGPGDAAGATTLIQLVTV